MEFAKFYAKFIVGFSEILIEEMVEGTFNKIKPLSYSEGEIVRGLIKEVILLNIYDFLKINHFIS